MTRWKRVTVLCVVGLLVAPARPAQASFWERVGKMSGPGPFLGLNLLFPFSLSCPKLRDIREHNAMIETLTLLGVETTELSADMVGLSRNVAQQEMLDREFGLEIRGRVEKLEIERLMDSRLGAPPGGAPTDEPAAPSTRFIEVFLDATDKLAHDRTLRMFADEKADVFRNRESDWSEEAQARLEALNEETLARRSAELRQVIRRYDAGPAGLFGGFRTIPLEDATSREKIRNRYFTFSLGMLFAYKNEIPYPDGFEGDRDVIWLSAFPAFEQRFPVSCTPDVNLFLHVGPAAHYFIGAQFDDFFRVSARGRLGVQWKWFYIGGQADYFFKAITIEDFGGVPDPEDLDRWSLGWFFGIDLTGAGGSKQPR